MARLFIDGFEHGSADNWTAVGTDLASVVSSADPGFVGDYCLKLATNYGAVDWHWAGFASAAEVCVSLRFRLGATGNGLRLYLHNVALTDYTTHIDIVSSASGTITVFKNDNLHMVYSQLATTTAVIGAGVHALAVRFKPHTLNGTLQVYLDEALVIDLQGVSTSFANNPVDAITFGNINTVGDAGSFGDLYIDDVIVDDADLVMGSHIAALVPATDVAVQFTPSVGTDNFACVDAIPDNPATYVATDTDGFTDSYSLTNLPADALLVRSVQVQALAVLDGTPTVSRLAVGLDPGITAVFATGADVSAVALSPIRNIWQTNPDTSAAWEPAAVDSLIAGIKAVA